MTAATPTAEFASLVYGPGGVALHDAAETYHEASSLYPDVAPGRIRSLLELQANPALQQTVARASYTRDPRIAGRRDRRYLIVVPSVGQPRDGDPRAGYLLWDDVAWTFEHVRLPYDLEGAMRRILAAELPAHLAERLRWGE